MVHSNSSSEITLYHEKSFILQNTWEHQNLWNSLVPTSLHSDWIKCIHYYRIVHHCRAPTPLHCRKLNRQNHSGSDVGFETLPGQNTGGDSRRDCRFDIEPAAHCHRTLSGVPRPGSIFDPSNAGSEVSRQSWYWEHCRALTNRQNCGDNTIGLDWADSVSKS